MVKKISWNNLKTVNILVGNNGSGKTTFLNRLCDLINGENQKKNESFLSKQLEFVINQNSKAPSFFNYRLRALDDKKNADSILKNIDDFFECVNKFFQETKKKIDVSSNPARLFFQNRIWWRNKYRSTIIWRKTVTLYFTSGVFARKEKMDCPDGRT